MWTVLTQYCQFFLETFSKDLFGSFPGSGQVGPVSLGRSFSCVCACVS